MNSLFQKKLHGGDILNHPSLPDCLRTVGGSICKGLGRQRKKRGANSFDDLIALQGHARELAATPANSTRVSTNDQQTIPPQIRGSGASRRQLQEKLLEAARRREIDVVLGFVSLTEALDLTTPAGRATAGLLAVFAGVEREIA
ncbi:MAG TPA: hypothetical protein VK638_05425, partial [Edaphobacter sp.]|nr:hypothetical protein [Edaphobacter sp.]